MNEVCGGFMTFLSIKILTNYLIVYAQCTLILTLKKRRKLWKRCYENVWIAGIVFTPIGSVWFSSGEVGFI